MTRVSKGKCQEQKGGLTKIGCWPEFDQIENFGARRAQAGRRLVIGQARGPTGFWAMSRSSAHCADDCDDASKSSKPEGIR
jgi:hypothetical protein